MGQDDGFQDIQETGTKDQDLGLLISRRNLCDDPVTQEIEQVEKDMRTHVSMLIIQHEIEHFRCTFELIHIRVKISLEHGIVLIRQRLGQFFYTSLVYYWNMNIRICEFLNK